MLLELDTWWELLHHWWKKPIARNRVWMIQIESRIFLCKSWSQPWSIDSRKFWIRKKTICLMTSISQVSAQPNRWTYGASKGALWTLVRHSALELAKDHGCRINSVSPSWIWTPEVAKVSDDSSLFGSLKIILGWLCVKRRIARFRWQILSHAGTCWRN